MAAILKVTPVGKQFAVTEQSGPHAVVIEKFPTQAQAVAFAVNRIASDRSPVWRGGR